MASAADRAARLNTLVAAAQAWATARTTYLNNQVALLQAIMAGRSSANQVAQAGVTATSALVSTGVTQFLNTP